MDRRTLILCLVVLAFMLVGTGVAVALLYSDGPGGNGDRTYRHEGTKNDCHLFNAVPSDALVLGRISASALLFPELDDVFRIFPMAFSLHYSGKLIPLFVFAPDSSQMEELERILREKGYRTKAASGFVLASESEALVRSACRHLDQGVSIMDDRKFAEIASAMSADDAIVVSNVNIRRVLPLVSGAGLSRRHADFLSTAAEWTVVGMDSSGTSLWMEGLLSADDDQSYFVSALKRSEASESGLMEILPSFTLSAASLPMKSAEAYMTAYVSYLDSHQKLHMHNAHQKHLAEDAGMRPDAFMKTLDVREAAVASFASGDTVQTVNLLKVGNPDAAILFKDTEMVTLKKLKPEVYAWRYASFAAASFGDMFDRKDESCFTYVDGWIASGSATAVGMFLKGQSYTLKQYLCDAGCQDMPDDGPVVFTGYFSLSENEALSRKFLSREAYDRLSFLFKEKDCCPVFLSVGRDGASFRAEARGSDMQQVQKEIFERDTVVVVPHGPFKVTNSHTGKTNLFYQNSNNAICLQDEKGKDLWGVPFSQPICGRVHDLDYYANGKIQFLFGAGSRIYLIDRLSRYVNGFPVELGSEILLGPDVYDFSGAKRYNIMVLHKDGTIQMYNLKGKKPEAWKGIRTDTGVIKDLPERIVVGGSGFWVVRTSMETLIYPFYGGEPVTVMEGDQRIRPDSVINVLDATSVEVTCYDGRTRQVKLK